MGDSWGKLGVCLFDSSPSLLTTVLGIPSTPILSASSSSRDENTSRWAGNRIICAGDDCEDYPVDLLTEGEVASFRKRFNDENLYWVGRGFSCCPNLTQARSEWFSTDHIWVLRNLTKLEYVRADAIAVQATHLRGPFIDDYSYPPYPDLGAVILSRISWSFSNSTAMRYEGNITRGVWAGDRFDIRTIDSIETACNGEHWKDVSEEVAQEIFAIWESEHGPGWATRRYSSISDFSKRL